MKKYLFSLLMMLPFLSGCESLSKLTQFDLPFTQSITIPAPPALALATPITVKTPDIQTNIDSVLNSYGLKTSFVEKISLKKMKLTVSSPAGEDLSFFKDVVIYISADGLDELKIASATNISTESPLPLITEGADLKTYLLKDKFKLKIVVTTDELTTMDYKVDVDMIFGFDAKILGL